MPGASTDAPQHVVVEQRGGVVQYRAVRADYEGSAPAALVRLSPEGFWDSAWFATGATLSECTGGNAPGTHPPLVFVRARAPGYTAPTRVVVSNADAADDGVVGPGTLDPTITVRVNGVDRTPTLAEG